MNAIIIHGFGSNPDANWFRWLRLRLEEVGVSCVAPKFPTPDLQSVKNWMSILAKHGAPTEDTILIGHSLGGSFILSALEKYPAKAAFIVAGPYGMTRKDVDTYISEFINKNFDFESIKKNCKNFHLYYSTDDDYVPIEHGEKLAKKLGVAFQPIPGSGHFMMNSFPRLLEDIKKLAGK